MEKSFEKKETGRLFLNYFGLYKSGSLKDISVDNFEDITHRRDECLC